MTDNGSCSLRSHTVGDCYVLGWAPAPRFLPSVDCIKVQCRLYQSTVWTVPKYCVDWSLRGDCNKVCGMKPKCPVYLCLQNEHTRTLKSLQYMSVFGGLWKLQNNPASTKSVKSFYNVEVGHCMEEEENGCHCTWVWLPQPLESCQPVQTVCMVF